MGLFKKLKGKSKADKAKAEETGTVLRQSAKATPATIEKERAELTALEMADKQDWEVKTLPVWQPGDVILDTYEVEDVISGGMGHVYIANHKNWNVKLAIKSPNEMMLSDKSNFARILREANSWTELGLHPNIAYCYYVRNIEDVPHIFVEYVDGGNLRRWIQEGKCNDYRTSLDLAIQFCHGVEHAHSKGMIHRDIKPANVLMTADGVLKVTDFGLVRTESSNLTRENIPSPKSDPHDPELTGVGIYMGTHGYMAPEQAENAHGVDERADIFSFGVCLYELFCGNRPFKITAGTKQEPPDPVTLSGDKDFSPDLADVLTKCVMWDPAARFTSFKKIRQEFIRIYSDLFNDESPYTVLQFLDLEADGLNNKGVSLSELGNEKAALKCWQQATNKNPIHLKSNLNLGYFKWKNTKITDDTLMKRIEDLEKFYSVPEYFCPTMRIYLERGMEPWRALKLIDEELAAIRADGAVEEEFRTELHKLKHDISVDGEPKEEIPTMASLGNLEGHTKGVFAAAFSPDDKYILSGGEDHTIRLWEIESLKCLRVFDGHADEVRAVAFLPGGHQFVSGSFDMTIKVWDIENKICVKTLKGHELDISSLAVMKDGKRILSGSYDGTIKLWETKTGDCLKTYRGHKRGIIEIALAPDNLSFISTGFDNTMRIWSLDSEDCLKIISEEKYRINSAKFFRDGRYLVTGCSDQTIRLLDVGTGACVKTFSGHTGEISSIDISPNGKYILTGGRGEAGSGDKSVRLWEIENGRCQCTLTHHNYHNRKINAVCFSSTGVYALSASGDHTLRLWITIYPGPFLPLYSPQLSKPLGFKEILKKKRIVQRVCRKAGDKISKGYYKEAYEILRSHPPSFDTDADELRQLIAVCGNQEAKRIAIKKVWNCLTYRHKSPVNCVVFSPDRKRIFSGSRDGEVRALSLGDKKMDLFADDIGWVSSIAVAPDASKLVTGHWQVPNNSLKLWDSTSGHCLAKIDLARSGVFCAGFSPDGHQISAGCYDGTIHVIKPDSDLETFVLLGHSHIVYRVAFFNNGKSLLSISRDKTVRIWDLQSRSCVASYQMPAKVFCFHPDGKHLFIGSTDLSMVDLNTGKSEYVFETRGKLSEFDAMTLSNDGRFVLTGHREPYIHYWDVSQKKLVGGIEGHQDSIFGLQFSEDCRYAVSGSWDHSVRLWEFDWDWEFDD